MVLIGLILTGLCFLITISVGFGVGEGEPTPDDTIDMVCLEKRPANPPKEFSCGSFLGVFSGNAGSSGMDPLG
jgi:hypothetical protein